MRLACGLRSDAGRVRLANEDSFYASASNGLFIVADGMGGHAGGSVASQTAVEAFVDYVLRYMRNPEITPPYGLAMDLTSPENVLRAAMMIGNSKVFELSEADPSLSGMGTTLTAAWILDREVCIAHVGDTRIYLAHEGVLNLLTKDHSWVFEQYNEGILTYEEARIHPMKHLITRSLGTKGFIQTDTQRLLVEQNDLLLLCSDGLTNMIDDDEIAASLRNNSLESLDVQCDALVEDANQAGGSDNITVVLVRIVGALDER